MGNKNLKPKQNISIKNKKVIQDKKKLSYRKPLEILAIFVLVFITYGNAINNDYNLDDGFVVSLDQANLLTEKGIKGIPEILRSKYSEGEGVTYGYRPLGRITMAIEYSLWGNNPHYSHFVNLLLYSINVYLLLLFITNIAKLFNFSNQRIIYLAVLLFIVHPLHTEVVCSIKNREEILCFSLLIAAVLFYFKFIEEKKWWYLLPFLAFAFLAFLAKETAFNIFGILLMIIFFRSYLEIEDTFKLSNLLKKIISKRNVLIAAVAFISLLLFNKLSSSLPFGDIGFHFEQNPYHFTTGNHQIPNALQTIFFYVYKLFIPFPLLFYYGYDMLPLQNWNSWVTILRLIIVLSFGTYILYNLIRKENLFYIFWTLFFIATLLPFSNLLYEYYVTGIVGERLVYQTSAGFCLLLAGLIFFIADKIMFYIKLNEKLKDRLPIFIALFILIPFLLITINRNSQWKDKSTLFQHDIKYLSNSARANYMMAGNIMNSLFENYKSNIEKTEDIRLAKTYLDKAVEIYPNYDDAWLGIGNIYIAYSSVHDSAIYYFNKIDTNNVLTYSRALESKGDIYYFDSTNALKALDLYTLSFSKNSANRKLYKKIGEIMFKQRLFDALNPLAKTGIMKGWAEGYVYQGNVFFSQSDTSNAMLSYKKAFELGFQNKALENMVFNFYNSKK